jgi:hypothetical protein
MTELVTFLVGVIIIASFTYAGFLVGRDRGESKAAETVANLRRHNMVLRGQRDRAVENNSRLARALRLHDPVDPPAPEWMT